MLRADPGTFDVISALARYGQVFRFPIPRTERAEQMAPGQPCYLFSAATSRVVGVWGVGEVVGPVLELSDTHAAEVGEPLLAEVEILALTKPIAVDKLRAHRVLSRGELLTVPEQPNPVVLRPEELRALEEFEFEIEEPTEDQRDLVDAALELDTLPG